MNGVEGFSKLSKEEKINWLTTTHAFSDVGKARSVLNQYWNADSAIQKQHDEFAENTISNYYLPFGVAPNFLINGRLYTIPMVIEESSVVAAACKSAKFWLTRGGFSARVISTEKLGHVHFSYFGNRDALYRYFNFVKPTLLESVSPITKKMVERGGGVLHINLEDKTALLPGYYQLVCTFETIDAMGANFINSCLELYSKVFVDYALNFDEFSQEERHIEVIMSILSNYTSKCLVSAEVCCPIEDLNEDKTLSPSKFAEKFTYAVKLAEVSPHRAVTHNKGIMNGVDAVVLATGNDFRAVEACAHAYASRDGQYTSLTHVSTEGGYFRFWVEMPLALGTVGGLTALHPLSALSLEILGNPSASKLMEITAVAGLAQNFAALRSLITTGIQQGHMKMHLLNILNSLGATEPEKAYFISLFKDKTLSYSLVSKLLDEKRSEEL